MSDETMMLTYADAAKKLGIKVDSVRRRARNRNWKRIKGNDGLTLVGVPREIIPTDVLPDIHADNPTDKADTDLIVKNAVLETENRMLKEANAALKVDAEAWREMAMKRRSWWPFTR